MGLRQGPMHVGVDVSGALHRLRFLTLITILRKYSGYYITYVSSNSQIQDNKSLCGFDKNVLKKHCKCVGKCICEEKYFEYFTSWLFTITQIL